MSPLIKSQDKFTHTSRPPAWLIPFDEPPPTQTRHVICPVRYRCPLKRAALLLSNNLILSVFKRTATLILISNTKQTYFIGTVIHWYVDQEKAASCSYNEMAEHVERVGQTTNIHTILVRKRIEKRGVARIRHSWDESLTLRWVLWPKGVDRFHLGQCSVHSDLRVPYKARNSFTRYATISIGLCSVE
jgi:hypothetical protein